MNQNDSLNKLVPDYTVVAAGPLCNNSERLIVAAIVDKFLKQSFFLVGFEGTQGFIFKNYGKYKTIKEATAAFIASLLLLVDVDAMSIAQEQPLETYNGPVYAAGPIVPLSRQKEQRLVLVKTEKNWQIASFLPTENILVDCETFSVEVTSNQAVRRFLGILQESFGIKLENKPQETMLG